MHLARPFVAFSLAALAVAAATSFLAPSSGFIGPAFAASACVPARSHASGNFNETISSGGFTRQYILHVPPSYSGTDATPVVLNFHGFGSSAAFQAAYSELPTKSDQEGFVLVSLQGWPTAGTFLAQPHWNFSTTEASAPDDIGFVNDLLDTLELQLCIDSARLYSTGISNGGFMSTPLACSLSNRIAAIGPVAGYYFPPLGSEGTFPQSVLNEAAGCPSKTRAVPIIEFHGIADLHVPFLGGFSAVNGLTFRLPIEDAAAWAANHVCGSTPESLTAAPGVRRVRYSSCNDGAEVQVYIVEDADGAGPGVDGGGHTWPGASIDLELINPNFGKTTQEISANDLMWDFFLAHPLSSSPLPDSDGDTVPDFSDVDNDNDGCSDGEEVLLNEGAGGQRNPKFFWDFFDVWTGGPSWLRNKAIAAPDFFGVLGRFGSERPGGPPTKGDALTEALIPPSSSTGYHAAFDRSFVMGFLTGSADGAISATDFFEVLAQFGHDCTAPP